MTVKINYLKRKIFYSRNKPMKPYYTDVACRAFLVLNLYSNYTNGCCITQDQQKSSSKNKAGISCISGDYTFRAIIHIIYHSIISLWAPSELVCLCIIL